MNLSHAASIGLCLLGCAASGPARAQAAQEYGVLVGTVTPGVGAQARGLGAATAGAIGNAANAVAAVNQRAGSPGPGPARRSGPPAVVVHRMLPLGDPLEGTDAPFYTLANGRTLRVSGAFALAAEPVAELQQCVLRYAAITVTGGYRPSGPPRDECLNAQS
jgi:hypothetical protein